MTYLEQFTAHLSECGTCNEQAPMVCREGERLLTHIATDSSTTHMRAALATIFNTQPKPPKTEEETRPLSLIEAEFLDASNELAECVREQAASMLVRADGIVRSTEEVLGRVATDPQRMIKLQAFKNQWDLNEMKEQELTLRIRRLSNEWSMRTGK